MTEVKSLKIGSATITWNSNGYLHIDQPLVTAGDQIVISGTPGGGGGGGATSLWGLDDVSVPHGSSTPSNGQVLTWNSTLAKWTNQSITSGVSSVVGQTGAVTTAQIATALTGAGYKLTDTTYTNGTGISLSGTTFSLNVAGAKTALGLGSLAYLSSLAFADLSAHPTTMSGYGITDAKIANGVITLGSNTITPSPPTKPYTTSSSTTRLGRRKSPTSRGRAALTR